MPGPTLMPGRLLLAVALIAGAALGYELLLMRLMAIIQWHHFAAMIISLALLGYGVSGTVLALLGKRIGAQAERLFFINAAGLAVAMPACFALAQAMPFNGLALVWDPLQLLWLMAMYVCLSVPFLLAANCFGLLFCARPGAIPRIYAADLAGAGAGAALVLSLMWLIRPENLLLFLSGVVCLAVAVAQGPGRRKTAGAAVVVALVLVPVALRSAPWLELNITQFKSLPQRQAVTGAAVVEERWSPYALLSVVHSPRVPFREAPGLSLTTTARVPEQVGVFVDGHALHTVTSPQPGPVPWEQMAYLDDSLTALPYHLVQGPEVLVIEAGTGERVVEALFHGAARVTAQQLNPQLPKLASDVYGVERVHLRRGPTRQVLAADAGQYDLIVLSTGGGAVAAVNEDYAFTVEAVLQYLAHLSAQGLLAVSAPVRYPPRDSLRIVATVAEALRRVGVTDAGARVVVLRNWDSALVLVRARAFTAGEVGRVRRFAASGGFDGAWYPGISADEINRFHRWERPWLYEGARAVFRGDGDRFLNDYKFDVRPVSDDRPFAGQFFKIALIADLRALGPAGGALLLDAGYLIVLGAVLQAVAVSVLLAVLPLWLARRRGAAVHKWPVLVYFSAIGLAFLFVEIGYLQKLTLVLGDPLLAAAVVLSAFLVLAGLGSRVSSTLLARLQRRVARPMLAVTITLALLAALELWLLHGIGALLARATVWRVLAAVALITPLAVLMGVLFPAGLGRVAAGARELVPWAWAVNGCASVISALLALLLSMHLGFSVVIGAGAILYLLAGLTFARLPAPAVHS